MISLCILYLYSLSPLRMAVRLTARVDVCFSLASRRCTLGHRTDTTKVPGSCCTAVSTLTCKTTWVTCSTSRSLHTVHTLLPVSLTSKLAHRKWTRFSFFSLFFFWQKCTKKREEGEAPMLENGRREYLRWNPCSAEGSQRNKKKRKDRLVYQREGRSGKGEKKKKKRKTSFFLSGL